MCGIAGILTKSGSSPNEGLLRRMSAALAHRGPDSEGIWISPNPLPLGEGGTPLDSRPGVGFAHRRLAIVDLSEGGAQPKTSADGRYTIVFNGEIYNFRELRAELERHGVNFHSASDTEVIIEAYRRWEENCVEHLHGMFAFAMWDSQTKELFFTRDRIGKKPFFYRTLKDGSFVFASEMKALIPLEHAEIDEADIRVFLGLQYVPSPRTGFRNIFSLPPGHRGYVREGTLHIESYNDWHRLSVKTEGWSAKQIDDQIRERLENAVRMRLLADVPVGAFLSGGIDSAAVVAFASKHIDRPLRTYTMGFPEIGMDERAEAREISKMFGTDHQEFEATSEDLVRVAEQVIAQYDGPYADSSALPLMLLAEQTAKEIKVVLTGDGGDETFGGYRRYRWFEHAARLKQMGLAWPAANASWLAWSLGGHDPRMKRFALTLEGLRKSYGRGYADLFSSSYFSRDDMKLFQPDFIKRTEPENSTDWIAAHYEESAGVAGALRFDLTSYLPDDLNVKMDRATMAHGLEARAPFLDQDVVALAYCIPLNEKVFGGRTKIALKRALEGIVPDAVLHRAKRGFQVPLGAWFRGPLKSFWRERCLDSKGPLARYVRLDAAERLFQENERGIDHGNRLWMLLSLSLWLQRNS